MGLEVGEELVPRPHLRVDGRAPDGAAEGRHAAVVEEGVGERLGQHGDGAALGPRLGATGEVGVVALRLPRQRDVERVVDVVVPLRRHAPAALTGRRHHDGVVEVALGDEVERTPELHCERSGLVGQLGEDVGLGLVTQLVHGVETKRVDVEVTEPAQGVVDDPAAHLVAAVGVEVDGRPPRRVVGVGEVGPELGEVVARRSEVVVDDVEADPEPARVARVDEALERGGAAVGLLDGIRRDAVVAPAVRPPNAATGMTSTTSTPRSTRCSRWPIAASKVPSGVNVPTCIS